MMRAFLCSAIAAIFPIAPFAQPADGPRFEAADVHASAPAAPGRGGGNFMQGPFVGGGRFEIRRATVLDMVRLGWQVQPDKIVGGPSWAGLDRFDILAKAPAKASSADLRAMLQNLLGDRFGLKVHKDTKPLPAFALVSVEGKKPHLKEAAATGEPGCKPQSSSSGPGEGRGQLMMMNDNGTVTTIGLSNGNITYDCHNLTMTAFAAAMQGMIGTNLGPNPVSDETGLKGAWDFELQFSFNMGALAAANGVERVSFPDAVEKQLGLKLDKREVPMPVTMIDTVNQTPTPNPPGMKLNLAPLPTEFEVAAIKPTPPDFRFGNFQPQRGGRVNIQANSLKNLIQQAWGLFAQDQIAGLPKFADTDRWDIIAEAPTYGPDPEAETPTTGPSEGVRFQTIDQDSINVMLKNLLIDRFQIKFHMEERPSTAFVMTPLKPKMKKADPAGTSGCRPGPGKDGKDPRIANPAASRLISCENTTMKQFADYIAGSAGGYIQGATIHDETGLEGAFDFTLNFSVAGGRGVGALRGGDGGAPGSNDAAEPTSTISLSEAFEKQLGLKLEQVKRPGQVLVIDHIEQKPTEN